MKHYVLNEWINAGDFDFKYTGNEVVVNHHNNVIGVDKKIIVLDEQVSWVNEVMNDITQVENYNELGQELVDQILADNEDLSKKEVINDLETGEYKECLIKYLFDNL